MKALLIAVTAFFICWGVVPAADTLEPARPAAGLWGALGSAIDRTTTRGDYSTPAATPNTFAFHERETENEEAGSRRFEVVFFTSLPVTILISLLGVVAFRSAAGHTGDFTSAEYTYLALSSVGMSFYIAASDSRSARGGKTYRRGNR